MYKTGDIANLIPITNNEIDDFFNSLLDEKEYFNCDYKSLVSLRDYLLELKEKEKEYNKLIKEPLEKIQIKNTWCKNILPQNYDGFIMKAEAKRNIPIYITDDIKVRGLDILTHNSFIKSKLYSKKFTQRSEIIQNSKEELSEIRDIIKSLGFIDNETGLITASEHFLVIPRDFNNVSIVKKPKSDYRREDIVLNHKGQFLPYYNGLSHYNNKCSNQYNDFVIKKLYLRN